MAQKTIKITPGSSIPHEGGLDPEKITVKVDDEVIWKNEDSAAHCMASGTPEKGPDKKFNSGLFLTKSSFVHTFREKGTFDYFCVVHPWKKGQIKVE